VSDLHELDDLGGTAGRDLVPPSFESLEMTARHRRRLLAGTSAVAAVAVVGVLAAGIQAVGENNAQPANPTPNRPHPTLATLVGPTTTNPATPPPVRSRTPEQIVNDPRAEIFTMAVAPDDTDVRAAAWALCPKKTCGHYLEVVAVTDDGFATTHYLGARLDTDLRWVEGGGGFAVWLRMTPPRGLFTSSSMDVRNPNASMCEVLTKRERLPRHSTWWSSME